MKQIYAFDKERFKKLIAIGSATEIIDFSKLISKYDMAIKYINLDFDDNDVETDALFVFCFTIYTTTDKHKIAMKKLEKLGVSEYIYGEFAIDILENVNLSAYLQRQENWEYLNEFRCVNDELCYLSVVDLVVTDKCSLKCKDCSNLMQYFKKPEHFQLKELKESVKLLLNSCDLINDMHILGGEPFMYPYIYEIISFVASQDKINIISVFTNATIALKEEEVAKWDRSKICFFVTKYGDLSKNIESVIGVLKKYNISYRLNVAEQWSNLGNLKNYDHSIETLENLLATCCTGQTPSISGYSLHRCPFSASLQRLNGAPSEYFETFDLRKTDKKALMEFMYNKQYLKICNFCLGRDMEKGPFLPAAIQIKEPLSYTVYDL